MPILCTINQTLSTIGRSSVKMNLYLSGIIKILKAVLNTEALGDVIPERPNAITLSSVMAGGKKIQSQLAGLVGRLLGYLTTQVSVHAQLRNCRQKTLRAAGAPSKRPQRPFEHLDMHRSAT